MSESEGEEDEASRVTLPQVGFRSNMLMSTRISDYITPRIKN